MFNHDSRINKKIKSFNGPRICFTDFTDCFQLNLLLITILKCMNNIFHISLMAILIPPNTSKNEYTSECI